MDRMESLNDRLFDDLALEELERRLEMAPFTLLPGAEPSAALADHNGDPFQINLPNQHCGAHGGLHDCAVHGPLCVAHGGHTCVGHTGHSCAGHGSHCDVHGFFHCLGHGGHTCVGHGGHTCVGHGSHCPVHFVTCAEHGMSCVSHGWNITVPGVGTVGSPAAPTVPHPHSDAHN